VSRDAEGWDSCSVVAEVEKSPQAHLKILRELGYEFLDYHMYEGWLFLEESSAETIISRILIPLFTPRLRTMIRTYSAGGATNLVPSLAEFERLVVFIHLQPIYKTRLWVRADGDEAGSNAIARLRERFSDYDSDAFRTFTKMDFELYYPALFQEEVQRILLIQNKDHRRQHKSDLLKKVLEWTEENQPIASTEWEVCADEPIQLLRQIQERLIPNVRD
jgi:hypothetical protein